MILNASNKDFKNYPQMMLNYPQITQIYADEMMIVIHICLSSIGSNIIGQDTELQNK